MKNNNRLKSPGLKRNLFISILVGSGAIVSCGGTSSLREDSQPKIANGDVVVPADPVARSTVALVIPNPFSRGQWTPYCSGTLIEEDLVVTAAHCVDMPKIFVNLGLGHVAQPTVIQGKAYAHEKFANVPGRSLTYDVALIRLETKAPEFMQPVAIGQTTDFAKGDQVILAGYGRIVPKGRRSPVTNPGLLYQVGTQVSEIYPQPPLENETIQGPFGLIKFKSDDGLSGGCQGDSGGPMYLQKEDELLVIGSTVGGPGVCAATGYYTNLSQYEPWVRQVTATLRYSGQ